MAGTCTTRCKRPEGRHHDRQPVPLDRPPPAASARLLGSHCRRSPRDDRQALGPGRARPAVHGRAEAMGDAMSTTCPTCGREKHEGDCTDRVEWCASMLSFDGPLLRAAVAARVAAAVEAERQRIALRLAPLADGGGGT